MYNNEAQSSPFNFPAMFLNLRRSYIFLPVVILSFVLSGCSSAQENVSPNTKNLPQATQNIQASIKVVPQENASSQSVSNSQKVTVISPDLSIPLKSPLVIKGMVSGAYFSEGVFPVVLEDADGKEIARALAHADYEWMTEEPVAFTVNLVFKNIKGGSGTLIFKKDNPSGMVENNAQQEFKVIF